MGPSPVRGGARTRRVGRPAAQSGAALLVATIVGLILWVHAAAEAAEMNRKTAVSIEGQSFRLNGRPTYEGRSWQGMKIEGLLMNSRMVQGIFDDRNAETRDLWKYPDGAWDPERNTREFVAAMPAWRGHGLLAFTINLQGGSPQGYSSKQPWHNSAFEADGRLRADYLARLEKILDRADELGMVAILGYFYFGQDERLADEKAVIRGVENATDWLLAKGYANVLVEIDNECNVDRYEHAILRPARVHELIERVKKRSEGKVKSPAGRLLVSTSMGGGAIPPENVAAAGDFLLVHGNGVGEPDRIRQMVDRCRALKSYRGQPILFNEDDHFAFDKPDNNMIAAASKYASWGYFDYRMKGEGFDEGYQSVPTNWGLSSGRKRGFFGLLAKMTGAAEQAKGAKGEAGAAGAAVLEARGAPFFTLSPETGAYEIRDAAGGATWKSNPYKPRFGQVSLRVDGKPMTADLGRCEVKSAGEALEATFRPVADKPDLWVRVKVAAAKDGSAVGFSYEASDANAVERLRLLDDALWTTDAEKGYVVVPCREGLLIPADSGVAFTHGFDTYAYEGCHMRMVGVVKGGAAALVTWLDPYTVAEVRSVTAEAPGGAKQALSLSMVLSKSSRAAQVRFLGKGDYVTIAKAYRDAARRAGWRVTWDEKLKGHPDRAKYFGAINFKLWSTLDRRMNEDSSKELSCKVNWTFDEAAQVAEHLKKDLGLDRVLFIMGGWIRRGYDNQHPDILPTAPECGGDAKFTEACRRIRALGYVLSLHDNYQDMYRDSPSWDESCIQKAPGGGLQKGGHWAGGTCFITCAQRAVDLAKRPQNLPAVKKLSDADSYFIDTTYAAGLQECYDPKHPLTRWDDMKWKQAISDYGREVFGSFGSECGREWAIPHADFFEGLTGVSGGYYHDKGLLAKLGAAPVPLFEIVYRDCIAMYGKYGYDIFKSAEYVLDHISIGRPLNYHSIPHHLYWKEAAWDGRPLPLRAAVADFKPAGPRQFSITYRWTVGGPAKIDWPIFVHFTDPSGANIKWQNDHAANPPMAEWKPGEMADGPYTVTVPAGLEGTFDIRIGMYNKATPASRPAMLGESDNEHRYLLGKVRVAGEKVEFLPPAAKPAGVPPGDPALFCRGDGGWTDGLHHVDRYVKNTYEILSPLNEITSRVTMTQHEFLTPDRKVRRTVFGEGAEAVEVIVNLGGEEFKRATKSGGEVVLPPYGFVVDSPRFVAFSATKWNGMTYDGPAMFAVRSLDGKPIAESAKVRLYHGFGDPRIRVGGTEHSVPKEETTK
jgi:hypothetical protein